MTEIVRIKQTHHAVCIDQCKDRGQKVKLQLQGFKRENRVIIKSDNLCPNKKMCDCFIFIKDNFFIVVVCEIKSKNFSIDDVFEKISNGSYECEKIFNEYVGSGKKFVFYPIFLYESVRSPNDLKILRSKRIRFNGKKDEMIICEEGKKELNFIISKYSK
ncbi:hypothetical protein FTO68_01930 [Methanocalculus taiwanensis]|uniref:Uncharacterized protein n=1 Tax=Methanocalculus taiwanensis TaxID=106207 RepID=A0ABD4THJ5_9EURY|nr:hypothetical protein [Methanocalculus taiwanensis]MCQ1537752.1 hypothetical protein [Methanocalculus taiwanensis]